MAENNANVTKQSFGEKVGRFFKDYKSEFFKIKWPSPKDTLNKFYIVLAAVAAISVVLWGLDLLFNLVITWLANLG